MQDPSSLSRQPLWPSAVKTALQTKQGGSSDASRKRSVAGKASTYGAADKGFNKSSEAHDAWKRVAELKSSLVVTRQRTSELEGIYVVGLIKQC